MYLFRYPDEPDLDELKLNELLKPKKIYADDLSLLSDSSIVSETVVSEESVKEELSFESIFRNKIQYDEIYIPEIRPDTPRRKYMNFCEKYEIPFLSSVIKVLSLDTNALDLKFYGSETIGLCIIFELLYGPPTCPLLWLDVSNNPFEYSSCNNLSLFLQSSILQYLNISNCNIGMDGMEILAEGIEYSSLIELIMRNCYLGDDGGALLVRTLALNDTIMVLDISKNKLQSDTAIALGEVLILNTPLEILNLDWNELYVSVSAFLKFTKGFRRNKVIKELHLSWNGLCGEKLCNSLGGALRFHKALEKIYLEYNTFNEEDLSTIIGTTQRSKSLTEIYLGGSIWTLPNMFAFLKYNFSKVKIISFGEYFYLPKVVHFVVQGINWRFRDVRVIYKDKVLPNLPELINYRQILLARAKFLSMKPKKKKLKRDMGHFMLELRDYPNEFMKISDFSEGLIRFGAKLDLNLVNDLVSSFTIKVKVGKIKAKRIEIKEMCEMYLQRFPTDPPPPIIPKQKRGKGGKGGKGAKK